MKYVIINIINFEIILIIQFLCVCIKKQRNIFNTKCFVYLYTILIKYSLLSHFSKIKILLTIIFIKFFKYIYFIFLYTIINWYYDWLNAVEIFID